MSNDKQELMERIRALSPDKQRAILERLLEFALDTGEIPTEGSYRIADFTDRSVPTHFPWGLQCLEWRTVKQYKTKLEALQDLLLHQSEDEEEKDCGSTYE